MFKYIAVKQLMEITALQYIYIRSHFIYSIIIRFQEYAY